MNRLPDQAADFDAMVQLCIDACEAVLAHGTPEMRALARVLLLAIGQALAERDPDDA